MCTVEPRVRGSSGRTATGNKRVPIRATAAMSRPGANSAAVFPLAPARSLKRSATKPAIAAAAMTTSPIAPARAECGLSRVRRHCSNTGRFSTRRAARPAATSPPATAAIIASTGSPVTTTGVPRVRVAAANMSVPQQASTNPIGTATTRITSGSVRPNRIVAQRLCPRSLAKAISGPRASSASPTMWKRTSQPSNTSCTVTNAVPTSMSPCSFAAASKTPRIPVVSTNEVAGLYLAVSMAMSRRSLGTSFRRIAAASNG